MFLFIWSKYLQKYIVKIKKLNQKLNIKIGKHKSEFNKWYKANNKTEIYNFFKRYKTIDVNEQND